MPNKNLTNAKKAKNDEFYTQYPDIEKEMSAYLEYDPDVFKGKTVLLPCDDPEWSNFTKYFAQRFETLGLKKLISTSYAPESTLYKGNYKPTLFETSAPQYDAKKTQSKGKIFTLTKGKTKDQRIDYNDLEWRYLEGDGDFRSDEIKQLRDEADIIVTNPPFSLFKEYIKQLFDYDKKFIILGNKGSVIYKGIFPLFQKNKLWSGKTEWGGGMWFETTNTDDVDKVIDGKNMKNVPSVWLTNIDHGRRHQKIPLMTMNDNRKFNKRIQKDPNSYKKYDNYNAIEVPFTNAIPSDYDGIMGVPISFLDKYSPEQFEILWQASGNTRASAPQKILDNLGYNKNKEDRGGCGIVNGKRVYSRILIKHKKK
jgi:hypothetical protein